MKTYTVHQLAELAGVSVRTLHHYDQIGLLKPAFTGENRYRYYGETELLRLQQILLHRSLDIPLNEIGAILDAPGFDRLETLHRQRNRLDGQAKRFATMVTTIDGTIAHLQGLHKMKEEELYSGIVDPHKQADYEAWLIERYSAEVEDEIEHSRKAMADLSVDQRAVRMAELREIEEGLAEALRRGLPPQAVAIDPLLERHRQWVAASWGRECTAEAYAGLADAYAHPDFRTRFETIAPGFTEFLMAAMRAWARRQ